MTVTSLLYVPNSLDNFPLVLLAGEGAEELWPNVLGANATEVAPGALVGGPGQRDPIQDVESRGPDSLPTRVICSDDARKPMASLDNIVAAEMERRSSSRRKKSSTSTSR